VYIEKEINVRQIVRQNEKTKVYKVTSIYNVDNITKETKAIRVRVSTLGILKQYGKFGEHWDDCIQKMHRCIQLDKTIIRELQKELKKQKVKQ